MATKHTLRARAEQTRDNSLDSVPYWEGHLPAAEEALSYAKARVAEIKQKIKDAKARAAACQTAMDAGTDESLKEALGER